MYKDLYIRGWHLYNAVPIQVLQALLKINQARHNSDKHATASQRRKRECCNSCNRGATKTRPCVKKKHVPMLKCMKTMLAYSIKSIYLKTTINFISFNLSKMERTIFYTTATDVWEKMATSLLKIWKV
ncbi:uncharacterized protein LOC122254043 [Penaeus japonicus]|uniref:uncharacterized protein LOC122254043 n=1 Tax=Penaeus japonicus TaxID=27405 RepID=UPI001C711561|nr:uncharacterized protein LOC122254043 [Penaeus japonicus]